MGRRTVTLARLSSQSKTWEQNKNLRQSDPLHVYLAENNLHKLIPPKLR